MQKSSRITILIIVVIVAVCAAFTYWVVTERRESATNTAKQVLVADETAEPFTDLSGEQIELDAYLGNVLVVNSWASWSPHSIAELIMLNELAQQYSGNEMVFLAINRSETKEETQRFMRTLPELPHVTFVLDPSDRFFAAVEGYAMPETIIYDAFGRVVHHKRGVITDEELRRHIDTALAAKRGGS